MHFTYCASDVRGLDTSRLGSFQRQAWEHGNFIPVESIVQANQQVDLTEGQLLDLIYNEIMLREDRGERPEREEYLQRFPKLSSELDRQFDIHDLLRSHLPVHSQTDLVDRACANSLDLTRLASNSGRLETLAQRVPGEFGRYQVVRSLGAGGFGAVYLGWDDELQRFVAIKVLRTGKGRLTLEKADELLDEARKTAGLSHPHIVTVYDTGREAATRYIVSQFIDGTNLAEQIQRATFSLPDAVRIAAQTARALSCAHRADILHRDIKPANIILDSLQRPYLTDFGLAIRREDCHREAGKICGTPHFLPPEVAAGQGHMIDGRADVYSLGVVLYVMLCGRVPFDGKSIEEVLNRILQSPAPPLTEVRSEIPEELEILCLKALAKDPGQRFSTAGELAGSLSSFAGRLAQEGCWSADASWNAQLSPRLLSLECSRTVARRSLPPRLPTPVTRLVGRGTEVAMITQRIVNEGVRLITLTGVGGSGKTRLALEAGARLLDRFNGGVWFIELASLRDDQQFVQQIVDQLGVRDEPGRPAWDRLTSALSGQNGLLILDSFEHLVVAGSWVARLLNVCPKLIVLITSRVVLKVVGEHAFPVPPLCVNNGNNENVRETRVVSPAVELFVERARAVQPELELADHRQAISEICRRMDGLPLGIELAAARCRLFSPTALAGELANQLDISSGALDVPQRQQTLRQTMLWSYRLLSPRERKLLQRLGAFRGAFSLEAIVAINKSDNASESLTLELFERLVESSLVMRLRSPAERAYFYLLETVRSFALEELEKSGDNLSVAAAHAEYYLHLAEAATAQRAGPKQHTWLKRLDAEADNLRAVLERGLELAQLQTIGSQLAAALWWYWELRGRLRPGLAWLEAYLAQQEGDAESLPIIARAANAAGNLSRNLGDFERSRSWHERALAIRQKRGDREGVGISLHNQGNVASDTGNLEAADVLYRESLQLRREVGDTWGTAMLCNNLARLAMFRCEYEQAQSLLDQSIELFELLDDRQDTARPIDISGEVALRLGDAARATRLHKQALEIRRKFGDRFGESLSLRNLGKAAVHEGRQAEAAKWLRQSADLLVQLQAKAELADTLSCLSETCMSLRQHEQAVKLAAVAQLLSELNSANRRGSVTEPESSGLQAASDALGPDRFQQAWQEATQQDADKVIVEVLEVLGAGESTFIP